MCASIDENGMSSLQIACKKGNTEVLDWLVTHGVDYEAIIRPGRFNNCTYKIFYGILYDSTWS